MAQYANVPICKCTNGDLHRRGLLPPVLDSVEISAICGKYIIYQCANLPICWWICNKVIFPLRYLFLRKSAPSAGKCITGKKNVFYAGNTRFPIRFAKTNPIVKYIIAWNNQKI
jgi:hypothetical protein